MDCLAVILFRNIIFWIWLAVVFFAVVVHLRQVYSRFSRYNVKHLTPLPFLGNTIRMVFGLDHFVDDLCRTYNAFPGERFVGTFQLTSPGILLRDPELIKRITINDKEYFLGHEVFIDKDNDPYIARNIFSLKGAEWKEMRSVLSPIFTKHKLSLMIPLMAETGEQMLDILKGKIKSAADDYVDLDIKELTDRYANDVFASCAFGLRMDSLSDKQSVFYQNCMKASGIKLRHILLFFGLKTFPKLMNRLKISYMTERNRSFMRNLVMSLMRYRNENHIVKPDMIHLLMNAKKETTWSDDDLVAQAVGLIIGAGAIPTVIPFLLHELAVNPDVQEKLVQEIRLNNDQNGGIIDYNSLQHLTYLDMVISEVLRLWTPTSHMGRICSKAYNLGKPNAEKATQDYIIKKGEGLCIPVWAIHRDPKYFPDPLRFDPDRFSKYNKHNIEPYTYLPFGVGPRNCLALRFALCELKIITYQLLLSLELSPAAKTQVPAQLSTSHFTQIIKGGHWIRFRVRK